MLLFFSMIILALLEELIWTKAVCLEKLGIYPTNNFIYCKWIIVRLKNWETGLPLEDKYSNGAILEENKLIAFHKSLR